MEKKVSVFNDARLEKRLSSILCTFESKLGNSVPQASGNYHQAKGTYRFWNNKKVTPEKIMSTHITTTEEKCKKEEVVLSIQDTTELDFSKHKQTQGLGYLEKKNQLGIKVHTAIAVTGTGLPIGILRSQYWERPLEEYGKKKDRRNKPIEEKESYRWIDFHHTINEQLKSVKKLIHITDREGDIFEFLSADRSENQHILLRIVQDRIIDEPSHRIKTYLNGLPENCQITVSVGRKGNEPPREAKLSVCYGTVSIQCPIYSVKKPKKTEVILTVIKAKEIETTASEPIEWYLATTINVESLESVAQCLEYYSYRWLIERFHYILKSGCKVEELQLETSERLENAAATYNILAMRILSLTYLSRKEPNIKATAVFTNDELMMLKLKFKKESKKQELSLMEAMMLVAMLGGFMGRKSDGLPGLKTIWRGMFALEMMVEGLKLARMTIEGFSFSDMSPESS